MFDPILFLMAVTWHRPITLKGNVWGITPPPFLRCAKGGRDHPHTHPCCPHR